MRPADLSKTLDLLLNDETQRDRSNSPLFTVDCGSQGLVDCCVSAAFYWTLKQTKSYLSSVNLPDLAAYKRNCLLNLGLCNSIVNTQIV